MNYLVAISNLGDLAATGPIAIGMSFIFGGQRAWYFVLKWTLLLFLGMCLVTVSKIAFIGWGIGNQTLDFTGFSGHAMRAAAIFPVLGFLIFQKYSRSMQTFAVLFCTALSVMIAFSRFMLQAHSISEVISGWCLGAAISLYFIDTLQREHAPSPSSFLFALWLSIWLLPFAFITQLDPTPTQRWLVDISLKLSGHSQAFVRENWSRNNLKKEKQDNGSVLH